MLMPQLKRGQLHVLQLEKRTIMKKAAIFNDATMLALIPTNVKLTSYYTAI